MSNNANAVETTAAGAGADPAAEIPDEIKALSYQQAREDLVQTVQKMESGRIQIEESVALWQRAELLARHCENWLNSAAEKLNQAAQR